MFGGPPAQSPFLQNSLKEVPLKADPFMENVHAKELEINVFDDWRNELRAFVSQCGDLVLKEVEVL